MPSCTKSKDLLRSNLHDWVNTEQAVALLKAVQAELVFQLQIMVF